MEIVNLVNDKCQVIDSATGQIMFEGSYDDCFMCLATYEDEDTLYQNHLLMSGI
jgi:predicted lipid carrier protein YhbT